jgi:hypothetical protein
MSRLRKAVRARWAQNAIKPGNSRFVLAEIATRFNGAQIGGLQNVFRDSAVFNATLNEGEELSPKIEQ